MFSKKKIYLVLTKVEDYTLSFTTFCGTTVIMIKVIIKTVYYLFFKYLCGCDC